MLRAGDVGQRLHVVRVVRAGDDGLDDVLQVDLDHRGVFGVGVALQQLRVLQPGLLRGDAPLQRARVGITLGDHPLHQRDVAVDVLLDRLGVQVHGAAGGRALGRSVAELEGLFHLQVGQALDFEDAAGEDVLLALLGHGQQSGLDGVQRNRVHQVAQRHPGLHAALEAHQHAFGHVQRHHAGGRGKGHQARAGREADADRESACGCRRRCPRCRAAAGGSASCGSRRHPGAG